jgi:hypothetical protein
MIIILFQCLVQVLLCFSRIAQVLDSQDRKVLSQNGGIVSFSHFEVYGSHSLLHVLMNHWFTMESQRILRTVCAARRPRLV